MKNPTGNRGLPIGNPIANALLVVVGALAVGVSIVLGLVAFVALSGIVVVLAAIIGIRIWWFNRKLVKSRGSAGAESERRPPAGVIEGEYRVIDRDRDES